MKPMPSGRGGTAQAVGRRLFLGAALAAIGAARAQGQASAPPAAGPVSVPLEFWQERKLLIPMTVNGHAAEGLVDSGSDDSVIDAAFARSLGLELGGDIQATGVSGGYHARTTRAELAVGGVTLAVRRLAVSDLNPGAARPARPTQVILGGELFRAGIVEIDIAGGRLSLWPSRAFRPPPEPAIPLTPMGLLRTLPITVGGQTRPAQFDLGNSGALLLDQADAERRGLLKGRAVSARPSQGADGVHETKITTLPEVGVGGVVFQAVPTALLPLASSIPANVGVGLMSHFHMTIDFNGGRIWLKPYPGAAATVFRKDRLGLAVRTEPTRLVVTYVSPGSPAEAAKMRPGEAITAIDGRPIAALVAGAGLAGLTAGPPGKVIGFAMEDGTTRPVTLADYY